MKKREYYYRMNVDRLSRLVEILEKVPEYRFNMSIWAVKKSGRFVGCACGWASQSPEFKSDGLIATIGRSCGMVSYRDPIEGFIKGTYGVAKFFGIDNSTAERLFEPDTYECEPYKITTNDVIARIREVLDGKQN
jgi:hypothetical protein